MKATPEKVSRDILVQPIAHEGLNMINMFDIQKSLQFKWVSILTSLGNGTWRILPTRYFDKFGKHFIVFNMNTTFQNLRGMEGYFPSFYMQLIKDWFDRPNRLSDLILDQRRYQILWNNELVTYKGKPIFIKRWLDKGITHIRDIIDERNNNIVSYANIADIVGDSPLTQFEYNVLINSITPELMHMALPSKEDAIYFSDIPIHRLKSKQIRQYYVRDRLVNVSHRCGTYFTNKYGENTMSSSVWELTSKITKEVKMIILQWKILHGIYPTRLVLFRSKITETDKCLLCDMQDSIEHYFVTCKSVLPLWCVVFADVAKILTQSFDLSDKYILLGVTENNDNAFTTDQLHRVNNLILLAKFCIHVAKVSQDVNVNIKSKYLQEKIVRGIIV